MAFTVSPPLCLGYLSWMESFGNNGKMGQTFPLAISHFWNTLSPASTNSIQLVTKLTELNYKEHKERKED